MTPPPEPAPARGEPSRAASAGSEPRRPPEPLAATVTGLHHVAVAVPSIAAARLVWEGALGLAAGAVEHVADQRVNVLVLHAGNERVELVEPAGEGSPIAKFLGERGAGLHHLAWRVDDVRAAIASLLASGVRMIDHEPRAGAHGTRIAFLHPKSTGGVLMEIVEDPHAHEPSGRAARPSR